MSLKDDGHLSSANLPLTLITIFQDSTPSQFRPHMPDASSSTRMGAEGSKNAISAEWAGRTINARGARVLRGQLQSVMENSHCNPRRSQPRPQRSEMTDVLSLGTAFVSSRGQCVYHILYRLFMSERSLYPFLRGHHPLFLARI